MHTPLEVSLPAVPVSVRTARETVAGIAASLGARDAVIDDARLCVSEATTNVVRHAYRDCSGDLDIRIETSDRELTVIVRDAGIGLAAFQSEGELGHGLRIIEQLTKRCAVTSVPGMGTEIVMVFPLESEDAR
jgi:anti-sigma regulatory factor (Ser/Thr protein kinase)